MDEFHFYAEPDRGWAWQVPLLELPQAQFLLLSATLGDVGFFTRDLTARTGRPTALVDNGERPVPLYYSYVLTPLQETIEDLLAGGQAPIYVVHFTQESAIERAQALMSINVCTREEKDRIAELIGDFRFTAGFGRTLSRLVRHGIGVHHAGMLPKYRRLVETLAQAGLLKVICGTDTLGVGINVPIRTVLFTGLSKYDGIRTRTLKVREFHQIAGRAGRAGFDEAGGVVVQAPEHVIANEKALAKAGDDPRKRRQVVRKKPPEGFVSWGEPTYDRLVGSEPETLTSQFAVTHSMVLNVIARPGDPVAAMRRLLTENHDDERTQRRHIRRAIAIYRSLLAGGVIERLDEPEPDGRTIRLTVDLPPNFALNQELSPLALGALELLDRESPTYALDVVSVIESILDDPRQVLSAQRFKARGEAVAAMKSEGIEYDERMELLADVTHPRPLAELLDAAYEIYKRGHPWVADYEMRPKSVVRDMFERAMNFVEYVGFYQLARSEGLVLRYLADAYRTLRQTVPEAARTEELDDIIEWLGELVRQVDSSLLDEWEQLRAGTDDDGAGRRPCPPARRGSRRTPARSGCSCATRSSAASSSPPAATGSPSATSTPPTAGVPTSGARRSSPTSTSTPRSAPGPMPAARRGSSSRSCRDAGGCARSSTTPPATTTGASPPTSTSRPATRSARRCSPSPTSGGSEPAGAWRHGVPSSTRCQRRPRTGRYRRRYAARPSQPPHTARVRRSPAFPDQARRTPGAR